MEYLSNDKILVIDLGRSEITEDEISEELVEEKIGGAAINRHLYEAYQDDDPVIIGTGLLTGTMYPASAAGVITAKSPVTGNLCHCPITLKVGVEIKYSGFDYIVVKGRSEKPVYLWIHDGVADITDAADIWGKDVWETTDALRKLVGDDLLQTMMIGKAGETGSDFAQVCLNHWSSGDRFGFGKLFGQKMLKGFAFRGMGLLEAAEPEDFVDRIFEILPEIKAGAWVGKKGIGDVCAALGEDGITDWLAPLVHRHSADYFTPFAGNTFVFLDEDPKRVEETKVPEPGVLISDIPALIGLKKAGCTAEDACRVLKACAKYGIDPAAIAELSQTAGKKTAAEIEDSFDNLSGNITLTGKGVFSPWCPVSPIFGEFDMPDGMEAWWERRQAVAYTFGIQPLFAVMCPELTEEDMLELSNIGTDLELSQETLDSIIEYLCG